MTVAEIRRRCILGQSFYVALRWLSDGPTQEVEMLLFGIVAAIGQWHESDGMAS